MDDTDRVRSNNVEFPSNFNNDVARLPLKENSTISTITRKQKLRSLLIGRCLALRPGAFIPVHLDPNGVAIEDICEESPCTMYDSYFVNKNKRWLNLALESEVKLRSVLELTVNSDLVPRNGLENMYVELFRGTEECELIKVTDTYSYSNIGSGAWTLTCEGVTMAVSQKVRQIYNELAQIEVELAKRKTMPQNKIGLPVVM